MYPFFAYLILANKTGDSGMVIAIIVGVGACIVAGLIYSAWWERKRTDALHKLAKEMSLEFHETGDVTQIGLLAVFDLFAKGHSRTYSNLMLGPSAQVTMAAFDYRYTTGSGKHQSTHHQTVLSFKSDHLHLPQFTLRPENLFDKLGEIIGFRDIDFRDYPEFSRRYLLRGNDEEAVRDTFGEGVIRFFERHNVLCAEGSGDQLIVYRADQRLEPEELKKMLTETFELYKLLTERAG